MKAYPQSEAEEMFTIAEACELLQISRETAYRWLRAGRLRGTKRGGEWRLPARHLLRLGVREAPSPYTARRFTSCDLFSGAGGLSLGFTLEGFETLFFNDIDPEAALTFQKNLPHGKPLVAPIQDISARDALDAIDCDPEDIDVILGGPPCQGFSINAPLRSTNDQRNHLFRHYVRLVLEGIRPKFIVFENVPGLVSFDHGQTLRDVCAAFRSAGYEPCFRILNACHYGVPQERWRILIVANRVGIHFDFAEPMHYSLSRPNFTGGSSLTYRYAVRRSAEPTLFDEAVGLMEPIRVEDAIGDLPPIRSGGGADTMAYTRRPVSEYQRWSREGSSTLHNHHCVDMSEINLRRMAHVQPGGSWRDIPRDLLPNGMKRAHRSDHTRRYGRLDPNKIAFTVMTKCDPHWGTVVHFAQDRVISVREAARFQSFPDSFVFSGSKASQYRQVGNAVPPLLARAIARRIKSYLEEHESESHSVLRKSLSLRQVS